MSQPTNAIKLTKQELRDQKNTLKRFERYLPTLTLKMRQLKVTLDKIEANLTEKQSQYQRYLDSNANWVAVFGVRFDYSHYVKIDSVDIVQENLAGINLPTLLCVNYHTTPRDYFMDPIWVNKAIEHIKNIIDYDAQLMILELRKSIVASELQITTQRVNLFEQIKIPQAKATIKKISVFLGDQYTVSVVRGKIAKQKIQMRGAA